MTMLYQLHGRLNVFLELIRTKDEMLETKPHNLLTIAPVTRSSQGEFVATWRDKRIRREKQHLVFRKKYFQKFGICTCGN